MKASVQCYSSKVRKIKNNFVKDYTILNVGTLGFLVKVRNLSKNYEICGVSPDFDNRMVAIDYEYKIKDKKFDALLEISEIPKGNYEVFTRWRKQNLEVFFIKKNFKYKFKEFHSF